METKKRWKRILIITASIVGGLIGVAILLGVLNAVVADGAWTFGWNDYRYDETGYEIGNATLPYDGITEIEIDWIDGLVVVEACDDAYISITEQAAEELHESVQVRWRVSEDGKKLTVKYRKSSYYFSLGSDNRQKELTLRIPRSLMEQMERIDLTANSTNVMVKNVKADQLDLETVSGNLIAEGCEMKSVSAETVSGAVIYNGVLHDAFEVDSTSGSVLLIGDVCPKRVDIETVSAEVKLTFPAEASMTLDWETASGKMSSDIALTKSGDVYVAGTGASDVSVETVSGSLKITEKE
jgi:hypothetical protein